MLALTLSAVFAGPYPWSRRGEKEHARRQAFRYQKESRAPIEEIPPGLRRRLRPSRSSRHTPSTTITDTGPAATDGRLSPDPPGRRSERAGMPRHTDKRDDNGAERLDLSKWVDLIGFRATQTGDIASTSFTRDTRSTNS